MHTTVDLFVNLVIRKSNSCNFNFINILCVRYLFSFVLYLYLRFVSYFFLFTVAFYTLICGNKQAKQKINW